MSGLSLFVCDPWESYIMQLQADGDRQQAEMEREIDLDAEFDLGREALLDAECDDCDPDEYLPEYAPRSYEICYPEVIQS